MRQDAHAFDSFSKSILNKNRVLALDLLGHGDSDKPVKEVTLDEHTEIVRGVVKRREFSDLVLVGHSVGGYISMIYAAKHPEEVSKVVLVDIGPRDPEADLARGRRWPEPPKSFKSKEEAMNYFRESYPSYSEEVVENRVEYGLVSSGELLRWKSDPKSLEMVSSTFMDYDFWPHIEKITVPTLLIKGAESETVSKKTLERMKKTMKDFTLVEIKGSGHQVPMECPKEFETAVKEFLQKA
jgi:pimeloyl-ACP methyl ester carboxylesterase